MKVAYDTGKYYESKLSYWEVYWYKSIFLISLNNVMSQVKVYKSNVKYFLAKHNHFPTVQITNPYSDSHIFPNILSMTSEALLWWLGMDWLSLCTQVILVMFLNIRSITFQNKVMKNTHNTEHWQVKLYYTHLSQCI